MTVDSITNPKTHEFREHHELGQENPACLSNDSDYSGSVRSPKR